ncbi:MAG: molybdopterin molybdenumtransferase MoeA [Oceanospirillales bacterium]|nr:MAG: molybdopterin molybdenumtransferase MoeA [Oceanospirillales bacterium]
MNRTLIPVEQALKTLLEMTPEAQQTEVLDLLQCAGRVLAEDVVSQVSVPPADNSSMDGYALRYQDRLAPLPVSQRVAAGHPPSPLKFGTCARIFTGGEIPAGADLVVMQEAVSFTAFDDVVVPEDLTLGQNIRPAGQDIRQGETIVHAGTRLDYRHLGLLASVGVVQAKVYRRVKVALLSTGDELVMPGTALQAGQIYNSNRFLLQGYLEKMGAEVVSFAQVADSYEQTLEAMRSAAAIADVILSTGGVSVGEEDHVKPAVEALGELSLWRLAMKPGKPLAFGRIGQCLFMGLPGNPVSTFVGAKVFLEPLLMKLSGEKSAGPLLLQGKVHFSAKTQIRQEYLRVQAVWQDQAWQLHAYANQNSGVLSSTVHTNALAIMPPQHEVSPGDQLEFWFY